MKLRRNFLYYYSIKQIFKLQETRTRHRVRKDIKILLEENFIIMETIKAYGTIVAKNKMGIRKENFPHDQILQSLP